MAGKKTSLFSFKSSTYTRGRVTTTWNFAAVIWPASNVKFYFLFYPIYNFSLPFDLEEGSSTARQICWWAQQKSVGQHTTGNSERETTGLLTSFEFCVLSSPSFRMPSSLVVLIWLRPTKRNWKMSEAFFCWFRWKHRHFAEKKVHQK